jgi:hypothetical protein
LQFQSQANATTQKTADPTKIKNSVIEKLSSTQDKVSARIDSAVSSRSENLQSIQQHADDNGYEHLANIANRATEAVNNAGQRATESVARRFDAVEQRVEQYSGGGPQTTQEDAQAQLDQYSTNVDARIAARDQATSAASDRLDKLEQLAIDGGYSGSQIAAYSDRVTGSMQQTTEHYEERSDQRIANMQSRLDAAYANTPEPIPADEAEGSQGVA